MTTELRVRDRSLQSCRPHQVRAYKRSCTGSYLKALPPDLTQLALPHRAMGRWATGNGSDRTSPRQRPVNLAAYISRNRHTRRHHTTTSRQSTHRVPTSAGQTWEEMPSIDMLVILLRQLVNNKKKRVCSHRSYPVSKLICLTRMTFAAVTTGFVAKRSVSFWLCKQRNVNTGEAQTCTPIAQYC